MSPRLETGFAEAEQSPGLVLWRVTNAWQAAQRAALKPLGLTHVQFVLLASLTWLSAGSGGDSDPVVTQRDLARHAGTDPMMTSQVLRSLEARELVRRSAHPTDARALALTVTRAGVQQANRAVAVVEEVDRAFFEPLGDATPAFTAALHRLAPT